MEKRKPFNINKEQVVEAYRQVKANKGAAGVDNQSIAEFEEKLEDNLYKLWNRLASGSYFPTPVKAVAIPKRNGGERTLGIPTVTDRIAQAVVKIAIEPDIDKYFHQDSYGYRPKKQALDAIAITRKRCWQYEWLVEYDIKGLFDNINHEKLMKVVKAHVKEKWQLLYIERWLKAPIQERIGVLKERTKGTPQGGVISPILSNLFMHYAVDEWMKRNIPEVPWARYADDGVFHCKTQKKAEYVLQQLENRLAACNLEINRDKTRIVYCGVARQQNSKSFKFLGYDFQLRRACKRNSSQVFTSFLPAISKDKMKEIRSQIRKDNIRARSDLSLESIAQWYNPKIIGWYNYFGKFYPSKMTKVWKYFNKALVLWAQSKYKKIRSSTGKAMMLIQRIQAKHESLFFHWKLKQGKEIYV